MVQVQVVPQVEHQVRIQGLMALWSNLVVVVLVGQEVLELRTVARGGNLAQAAVVVATTTRTRMAARVETDV